MLQVLEKSISHLDLTRSDLFYLHVRTVHKSICPNKKENARLRQGASNVLKNVVELWSVVFGLLLEMRTATVGFHMKRSPKYNIGINY